MSSRIQQRIAALLVILLIGLTPLTAGAAGRKPIIDTVTITAVDEIAGHCGPADGGFDIIDNYTVTWRTVYHFRADGTWERIQDHEHYRGTMTNSVTGKVLEDRANLVFTYDIADDGLGGSWDTLTITQITITGQDWHTIVPGEGKIVHDSGILIVKQIDGVWTVVDWGGRHDVNMRYPELFFEVYCPLLAQE